MYIVYFDETGDDGYPNYSSQVFVLTSLYLHHRVWKEEYEKIYAFRRALKEQYGIPVKFELHTRALLTNKKPYTSLNLSEESRFGIALELARLIGSLDLQLVNVCIDKTKITPANEGRYKDVLDAALTFNIQRIENTIRKVEPGTRVLTITDEGRVGKMRKTTRKIQKFNVIPSLLGSGTYQQEIQLLIEDPLPKNSKESHFIQICDFVSFCFYLRVLQDRRIPWHGRLRWLQIEQLDQIIESLKPALNKKASRENDLGLVIYPK